MTEGCRYILLLWRYQCCLQGNCVGTVWCPPVSSTLHVFAVPGGVGFQTLLGIAYNRKRFGFLHSESKSCGRKPAESSTCASFPSL